MSKFLKRLLAVVSAVAVLLALGVVVMYFMANRTAWVPEQILDPVARAAAADRAERKLLSAHSLAVEAQSAETRRRHADAPLPTSRPTLELSFTEAEINAIFDKWDRAKNWRGRYGAYVTDPGIALRDGKLLVVGTAKEVGKSISVHFEPKLEQDGRLNVTLDGVYSGYLPLPRSMFEKYRGPLVERVKAGLRPLQRSARVDRDGSANDAAVGAAMSKILLRLLDEKSAEPVIFIRVDDRRHVPLKLTDIRIEDKTLNLTVVPLSPTERDELLARLREPYETASASSTD